MRELARRMAMFLCNYIIAFFPCWHVRRAYYHIVLRFVIGKLSRVDMRAYFLGTGVFSIGDYSHVNQGCLIDTRGGVHVGNSVSISHRVMIFTGSHDIHAENFNGVFKSVEVGDHVFIGPGVIVLQGVKIGRGAVVAAGSVVTKDVEPYTIVGGVPARCLGRRDVNLSYQCVSTVKMQ